MSKSLGARHAVTIGHSRIVLPPRRKSTGRMPPGNRGSLPMKISSARGRESCALSCAARTGSEWAEPNIMIGAVPTPEPENTGSLTRGLMHAAAPRWPDVHVLPSPDGCHGLLFLTDRSRVYQVGG